MMRADSQDTALSVQVLSAMGTTYGDLEHLANSDTMNNYQFLIYPLA